MCPSWDIVSDTLERPRLLEFPCVATVVVFFQDQAETRIDPFLCPPTGIVRASRQGEISVSPRKHMECAGEEREDLIEELL
jgi:hypothetical protein